jgi:IS30 family transposase
MTHYSHLSNEERFDIHQAVRDGKDNVEMARALGCAASTIGREKKHNMWPSEPLARYF